MLLAGALLVGGLDRLISLDVVPAIVDPVWDTSALLSDSTLGKILADFAGCEGGGDMIKLALAGVGGFIAR